MFPDLPNDSDQQILQLHNPSGFDLPIKEDDLSKLLYIIQEKESVQFSEVEVIYTDEDGIVDMNTKHLSRDYVTDIISFRYDEEPENQQIEGSLYCCAPRIAEQSGEYESDLREEFIRVFIHGLLHLAGYDDQTDEDKREMTRLENLYLSEYIKTL